jgi:molybdopterin-guanine dinucleotide biosynthesis protein
VLAGAVLRGYFVRMSEPFTWKWRGPDNNFVSDLNQLLQRLCDAKLDFVIVGGFAATLHGSSLVTRDLDISLDNLIRAKEALGREKDLLAVKELKAIREKQGKV